MVANEAVRPRYITVEPERASFVLPFCAPPVEGLTKGAVSSVQVIAVSLAQPSISAFLLADNRNGDMVKKDALTEAKPVTLASEYTEVGHTIATEGNGLPLVEDMLRELAPYMDRTREVIVDGFYDTDSGRPAIMAKVRTSVEDARDVLSRIDRFQEDDWWWDHQEVAAFDLILSVGA